MLSEPRLRRMEVSALMLGPSEVRGKVVIEAHAQEDPALAEPPREGGQCRRPLVLLESLHGPALDDHVKRTRACARVEQVADDEFEPPCGRRRRSEGLTGALRIG